MGKVAKDNTSKGLGDRVRSSGATAGRVYLIMGPRDPSAPAGTGGRLLEA